MSDVVPMVWPEGLRPGDVIELADMREFVDLEDQIMPIIDPRADPSRWARRQQIGDILRAPKYNGRIGEITLRSMDEPYERLLDANERGWKFWRGGNGRERTQQEAERFITRYLGLEFEATALSTDPRLRGRISAELWYYPVTRIIKRAGSTYQKRYTTKSGETKVSTQVNQQDLFIPRGSPTGEAIRRVATKPHYDKGEFEAAHDRSRAIGLALLQEAMSHPISMPMQE